MTILSRLATAGVVLVTLVACNPGELVTDGQTAHSNEENAPEEYKPAPIPSVKVGEKPDPSTDEAGLWLITNRYEKNFKTAGHLIKDPALNKYVNDLVCKIAGSYCADIRVYLVRVPHFNASMAPNGMMIVWSGLLLRARDEAQFAAVLGHEIGHYLRRHSLQRFRNIRDTVGFLTFFSMGMGMAGVPGVADIAALAAMGNISSFSRSNEEEADAMGADRLAEAGYDPRAAAKVWQNLIEEEKRGEVERDFSFFLSSHPRSEDRQRELQERADKILEKNATATKLNRDEYLAAIAPFRTMLLRDEVRLRRYKRSLGLFDMLLEENYRRGELHYFRGELLRLRNDPKENDRENALEEYKTAQKIGGYPPELYRSLGLLKLKMGQNQEAIEALDTFLMKKPNSPDRDYISSIIKPLRGS